MCAELSSSTQSLGPTHNVLYSNETNLVIKRWIRSCFLHFSVSVVSFISLIGDVFLSVLVCNPDLISLKQFMTFEQRYTTVAFILVY